MNLHLEKLNQAAPTCLLLFQTFHAKAMSLGIPLLVVRCWSSLIDQEAKYQQGRTYFPEKKEWVETDPSKIITRAKPGRSAHNVVTKAGKPAGVAVDVIPVDVRGNPIWDTPMSTWQTLYDIAWSIGLDPLGDKKGRYLKGDLGHFELPNFEEKLNDLGLKQPEWNP